MLLKSTKSFDKFCLNNGQNRDTESILWDPEVANSIPQNRRLFTRMLNLILYNFFCFDLKLTEEGDRGRKIKAGSSTLLMNYIFIYLKLDLGCVETECVSTNYFSFATKHVFEGINLSSVVNLRMTHFLNNFALLLWAHSVILLYTVCDSASFKTSVAKVANSS